MIRVALLVLLLAVGLGRSGDALVAASAPGGPSQDGGLAAVSVWSGPSDDLITARVLLHESGAANLTILAGAGDCGSAPEDATADGNPDRVFTAVFAACCKVCSAGKACGDSCIAASLTCHKAGGCACNAGAVPAPNPTVLSTPTRRAVISVVGQSPFPTIRVGQTAELLLTADVTGAVAPDGTLEARVANTFELGQGVRGWDTTGLIALNRAVPGSSTRQVFRALVEGVKPGTYRLRVVFSDGNGTVPPDSVYWDISVVSVPSAPPVAVTPVAQAPTQAPSVSAVAREAPTQAPAAPGSTNGSSGGPGGATLVLVSGLAATVGWVLFRRRRSNL
jgi:hypothetical protein